jgi:hypothetical protein
MRRSVAFVPLLVVFALVILPSGQAGHLSMDMPGLGGAALPPPSFVLLATTALAALLQGAWLLRGSPTARDVGWALALAPLAVSAARTLSLSPTGEDLDVRIAEMGGAGSEHMWALLAAIALAVGFGAARALEVGSAWRARDTPAEPRLVRAAFALALTWPLVGLILATSTGVDWISSWIRWGGCGIAVVVCAGAALVPGRGESRALGGITFALAVGFSLLAEREYVEALGHAALAHRDPFDPAVGWVSGMREIAAAVEPRERYGPWLALLPWLAMGPGAAAWRGALPRLVAGLGVLAGGVLAATAISSRLDATALDASDAGTLPSVEQPEEVPWSSRVLPRTAASVRAKWRVRGLPREGPQCRAGDVPTPSVGPACAPSW